MTPHKPFKVGSGLSSGGTKAAGNWQAVSRRVKDGDGGTLGSLGSVLSASAVGS